MMLPEGETEWRDKSKKMNSGDELVSPIPLRPTWSENSFHQEKIMTGDELIFGAAPTSASLQNLRRPDSNERLSCQLVIDDDDDPPSLVNYSPRLGSHFHSPTFVQPSMTSPKLSDVVDLQLSPTTDSTHAPPPPPPAPQQLDFLAKVPPCLPSTPSLIMTNGALNSVSSHVSPQSDNPNHRLQSERKIVNDPQTETDEITTNALSNGAHPSSPSNRDPATHQHSQQIPSTDQLDVLIVSINRLTDVLQQSFLKLDNSLQVLVSETKKISEMHRSVLDRSNPLLPTQTVVSSTETSLPPPPSTRPQTAVSDSQQQSQERQMSRGSLFTPPVPASSRRQQRNTAGEGRPSINGNSDGPTELPTVLSPEETHRRRLEEESIRAEKERERVAQERQRKSLLEQKTKSLMSSLMNETGGTGVKRSGLFDDDTSNQNGLLRPAGCRNPLFDA